MSTICNFFGNNIVSTFGFLVVWVFVLFLWRTSVLVNASCCDGLAPLDPKMIEPIIVFLIN